MKKAHWSISTTVRNPERLRNFLRVLKQLEGLDFDTEAQIKYQVLLIKERLYRPTNIPSAYKPLIDDPTKEISYDIAKNIFDSQNYEDPPMRGRQSVNPLNKLGFAIAKDTAGPIKITDMGNLFLSSDLKLNCVLFLQVIVRTLRLQYLQFQN